MCKNKKVCTDYSKWDTCRCEKMGCPGCYYYKNEDEVNKEVDKVMNELFSLEAITI